MASVKELYLKMNKEQTEKLKSEMTQLEEDLDAAEKRAEDAEKQEDAMYDDFKRDMNAKLDNIVGGGGAASGGIDQMQSKLYDRHMEQTSHMIKTLQSDVMRTNKVIREVARGINTDWKGVFEYLLSAQLSQADVKKEVLKVERQNRPLMQAYKALMTWKDIRGDDLSLNQLADALRVKKKLEWADYVYDVMDCEGDDYLKIKTPVDAPEAVEVGEDGKPVPKKKADSSSGVLDDRKFLQIAKKIGGEWEPMGTTLGLAEEDIKEIMEGEGATYQGAFKMLWTWRDRTIELDQDNAQILKEALKACGKEEVAELV